ncbi:MAG TPA: hypothetical protein VMS96_15925 [Terriglobales bacterium]|nr:hypothetical protein [Terriglobales bacterium]
MRAMWLIGGNLIREQRWLALVLAFYVLTMTVFLSRESRIAAGDVAFLVKQQAIYAVLFSAMLALSTIHNERKTRRILAVLSKSVTRGQYIGGLLLGIMVLISSYCALVFLAGAFLARRIDVPVVQVGWMMLVALVAALLAATIALVFASLLHPVLATAATGLIVALPMALEAVLGHRAELVLPVYSLSMTIARSTFDISWKVAGPMLAAGVAEAAVVGMLAVAVFSLKDIAVAVE